LFRFIAALAGGIIMYARKSNKPHTGSLVATLLAAALLGGAVAPMTAQAKSQVSYVPGISLVPEVLMPDGVNDRTYNTPQGLSLWMNSLPIQQGDKIKLNVFAATGGADLKQIIVRLDNDKLPDMPITTAPWSTVLDTTSLTPGYHMVEVWAEASGDKPQSTTRTLTFFVTKQMDAKYLVQPSQEQLTNGQTTEIPIEGGPNQSAASDTPQLPSFLVGQATDSSAAVTITARSAASNSGTGGALVTDGIVTINEPTLFLVQPALNSTATQFAYALVRDGVTFNASTAPLPAAYQAIRIEKRTDTTAGLRAGTVTLWIWGIDAQGQPSEPVKTQLSIP
jgi:hypothetical protein